MSSILSYLIVVQAQGRRTEAAYHLAKLEETFQQHPELLAPGAVGGLAEPACRVMADTYEEFGDIERAMEWDEVLEKIKGGDVSLGAGLRMVTTVLVALKLGVVMFPDMDRDGCLARLEDTLLNRVDLDRDAGGWGWDRR